MQGWVGIRTESQALLPPHHCQRHIHHWRSSAAGWCMTTCLESLIETALKTSIKGLVSSAEVGMMGALLSLRFYGPGSHTRRSSRGTNSLYCATNWVPRPYTCRLVDVPRRCITAHTTDINPLTTCREPYRYFST